MEFLCREQDCGLGVLASLNPSELSLGVGNKLVVERELVSLVGVAAQLI